MLCLAVCCSQVPPLDALTSHQLEKCGKMEKRVKVECNNKEDYLIIFVYLWKMVNLITHNLILRLRMLSALPSIPLYIFMVCSWYKHWDYSGIWDAVLNPLILWSWWSDLNSGFGSDIKKLEHLASRTAGMHYSSSVTHGQWRLCAAKGGHYLNMLEGYFQIGLKNGVVTL